MRQMLWGKPAGTPYALNVAQCPLHFYDLIIFPVVLRGSVSLRKSPAFPSNHAISLYSTSTRSVYYRSQLLHNHSDRFHVFRNHVVETMKYLHTIVPTGDYFSTECAEMFNSSYATAVWYQLHIF